MPLVHSDPSTYSVLEDLPFCLARATLGFRRFSDQTLRAIGLPSLVPGAASVLHALQEERRCTVNRLVERTHLPNGTLTGLLDELEGEEYLARFPNPEDGRSWLVGLTTAGLRLCAKLQKRHDMVMEVLGEEFTDAEQAELVRLLGKVTQCMRAYRPEERPVRSTRRRGSEQ
jgi:DNA-binding MarR family transcriptional regulator